MYSSLLDGQAFDTKIDELRKTVDVRLLAEPTLVTVSGRPAAFNVGGEFPILIPHGGKTVAVEYKQFGTRVDFVPTILEGGRIRLDVRPQVTKLLGDEEHAVQVNGVVIPALKKRWVDVASEMTTDQTMAVALVHKNRKRRDRWLCHDGASKPDLCHGTSKRHRATTCTSGRQCEDDADLAVGPERGTPGPCSRSPCKSL